MPTALDLITLADLKDYKPRADTARDLALMRFITGCSRAIESEVGRRIRYRGPVEVAGSANIRVSTALTDGPLAPSAAPNAAGRTLILTITPTDPLAPPTGGTVTVKGTVDGVADTTEVLDIAHGLVQHTLKFFTALHASEAFTIAGKTGGAGTFKVGSSVGYTEDHTLDPDDPCHLLPMEWPVQNILEVNEDASRTFAASTRLVAGTDYQLISSDEERMGRSSIVRLSSQIPTAWGSGWRGDRGVWSAGYSAAGVPEDIRDVARRLTESFEAEVSRDLIGIQSRSDPAGNFTRFSAARLTYEMRERLARYRRRTQGTECGARDFALEDAP